MQLKLDPPLKDVYIVVESLETGRLQVVKTDEMGKASVYLTAGTYRITASKEDWKTVSTLISVTHDTTITLTLTRIGIGISLPMGRTYIQLDHRGYVATMPKPFTIPDTAEAYGKKLEKPFLISPNVFAIDYILQNLNFMAVDYLGRGVVT